MNIIRSVSTLLNSLLLVIHYFWLPANQINFLLFCLSSSRKAIPILKTVCNTSPCYKTLQKDLLFPFLQHGMPSCGIMLTTCIHTNIHDCILPRKNNSCGVAAKLVSQMWLTVFRYLNLLCPYTTRFGDLMDFVAVLGHKRPLRPSFLMILWAFYDFFIECTGIYDPCMTGCSMISLKECSWSFAFGLTYASQHSWANHDRRKGVKVPCYEDKAEKLCLSSNEGWYFWEAEVTVCMTYSWT